MNIFKIFSAFAVLFSRIFSIVKNIIKNRPDITVPKIPATDKPTSEETNVLMCSYDKEISTNIYFPACDSSYTSLVDALKSVGANSDPSYRTTIAHLNGIENYTKSKEQNEALLKKLQEGVLIKSIETKTETITAPCDKDTTSNEEEAKPSTAIENTKDIKVLATSLLESVEGKKGCSPYKDSRGYPTIGTGKKCSEVKVKFDEEAKPYCSYLSKECTKEKADQWLSEDIDKTINCIPKYDNLKKAYEKCSVFRKVILISMCYQMGCNGTSYFIKALDHMDKGNWGDAAKEMINSRWHNQTTKRCEEHAEVMRTDECGAYCNLKGWS
jgi:lysozyme